jgi:hypothetical protein
VHAIVERAARVGASGHVAVDQVVALIAARVRAGERTVHRTRVGLEDREVEIEAEHADRRVSAAQRELCTAGVSHQLGGAHVGRAHAEGRLDHVAGSTLRDILLQAVRHLVAERHRQHAIGDSPPRFVVGLHALGHAAERHRQQVAEQLALAPRQADRARHVVGELEGAMVQDDGSVRERAGAHPLGLAALEEGHLAEVVAGAHAQLAAEAALQRPEDPMGALLLGAALDWPECRVVERRVRALDARLGQNRDLLLAVDRGRGREGARPEASRERAAWSRALSGAKATGHLAGKKARRCSNAAQDAVVGPLGVRLSSDAERRSQNENRHQQQTAPMVHAICGCRPCATETPCNFKAAHDCCGFHCGRFSNHRNGATSARGCDPS